MRKKSLLLLAITILVASTVVGCGEGSPCPSTLTILSITDGEVSVLKGGTEEWLPAEQETELDIGDALKTGGNSSAEITFFDGSTMELEADTEIKILSLDIVCSTGVTTIGLLQTIGTTISRVTAILDPASSYEVETPGGVVGVRGTRVEIRVFRDHWNYVDGTALVTNWEGSVYVIAQGAELDVPEGERCIMIPGQEPNLMPVANDDDAFTDEGAPVTIPVLNNDYDPDEGDTLAVDSVTQGANGDVEIIEDYHVAYSPDIGFYGEDNFTYTVSDGRGGTDTANVHIEVSEMSGQVSVFVEEGGEEGGIRILDVTLEEWAIDRDTGWPVNGDNHTTPASIRIAGEREYVVYVVPVESMYFVEICPEGWSIEAAPWGGTLCTGYLAANSEVEISFVWQASE